MDIILLIGFVCVGVLAIVIVNFLRNLLMKITGTSAMLYTQKSYWGCVLFVFFVLLGAISYMLTTIGLV